MKKKLFFMVALALTTHDPQAHGQGLAAHTTVSITGSVWTYTIFNDEPSSSSNYLTTFDLAIGSPVKAISSPAGWDYSSDGLSYISWQNLDTSLPYPHDVAPGSSLDNFSFQSDSSVSSPSEFIVTAWDHSADTPGPEIDGTILTPAASPVPESSTFVSLGVGLLFLGGIALIARKRARRSAS